jgi:uroporphyrinogen decarboxylase
MPERDNDLVVRAIRGERTERTPIWLMRQAGRTDPVYNDLRQECDLPLEELFTQAGLAALISLLPLRIGVDAIIFFQDILTPLGPMGTPFVFRPGPQLEQPVTTPAEVDALCRYDVAEELPFVGQTLRYVSHELNGALPVLGFCGAPLTLATFVLEGKSFGSEAPRTAAFLREHPDVAHRFLAKLADLMADYLLYQAESGADAVQLFESAAPLFDPATYREFAVPYQQRVRDALRGHVPIILFARDWPHLEDYTAVEPEVISLPASVNVADAREALGDRVALQGNLSNRFLRDASLHEIEEAALRIVAKGESTGHIFNLDHGLLRDTPFEKVCHLVQVVKGAGEAAGGDSTAR